MEINQDAQLDIIHQLIQRDLIFIVEEIFSFLDFSSLMNCECVSKDWNLAIRNGRSWQKIYNKESKKNPVFHTALLRYGEHEVSKCQIENDQFPSQFPFKRLFHTRQKIKENWGVGKYSTTILKIGKVRVTCHVMDEKRIALALVPEDQLLPIIKVVNRWTLKIECVLTGSVEKRNIIFLQLYGDMIFCGYNNGTITAWNITTRQIIHKFQDQTVENLDHQFVQVLFHAAGCLFVSCTQFVSIFGIHHHTYMNHDTHITIRRIVNPEEMVIDNTLVIPSSEVLQFDSIPNYFVLLFRNVSFKGRLQLRSEVDFQVVREIDIEIQSPIFSYTNGLLVTIDNGEVYTFWDPETLHKMFLFKAAFDKLFDEVFFTSYNLITRCVGGCVTIFNLHIILDNNGVDFVESMRRVSHFQLRKGEKRGFGRIISRLFNTCVDELQMVTTSFSQSTSKLVVRDFTKS